MKAFLFIFTWLYAETIFAQSSNDMALDVSYYCLMREYTDEPVPTQSYRILHIEGAKSHFHSDCKSGMMPKHDEHSLDRFQVWKNVTHEDTLNFMGCIDIFRYHYKEPIPQFDWELLDRDSVVCNYTCKKARTTFRGRTWTVWYTLDLPYSDGPWKLGGLPGLILKAEESEGDFAFVAYKIAQVQQEEMTAYETGRSSSAQEYATHKAAYARSLNEFMHLHNPGDENKYGSEARSACLIERY